MQIQIAAAKINKYAISESGDSLEVIERPNGGVSVVLADGQTSGRGAKAVSLMVVRKIISLLAEGVRDGAAARAASDTLFTEKNGKVSCTLNIASVDLLTGTIVLTRNNPSPIYIISGDKIDCNTDNSSPLGISRNIRPSICELELEPGLTIVMFTDGITHAGKRRGLAMEVDTVIQSLVEDQDPSAQEISDALLAHAIALDENRPADDISVVTLKAMPFQGDEIRRMTVSLPITPPHYGQ
ncbi:MAG: serine/threonine-protein phosphatase [Anaerolineales bacterium]|nr:serine/threonine-protein phosphatase [Anaerolineales bacterium]